MGYSIYERIATTFLVAGFELEWLAISHYFFVRKNPKGLRDVPQQAGQTT
uniref:Uncharacterized protein n=1 Tax=Staphylococcus epidermidis TaxID=1282 RepID=D2JC81_STAEP|nr:hypothetical protein [Staphylococcus epidermidis]ADA80206.1 hypothetical protein SAP106A_024 [Staphylococcus epidermidis]